MTGSLNTLVKGSAGQCREAADWLRKFARNCHLAGDHVQHSFQSAEGYWEGPAFTAFQASLSGAVRVCDDTGEAATKGENALKDFASALDSVNRQMNNAMDKAHSADLDVSGPFIMPPKPLPPGPKAPHGHMSSAEATKAVDKYNQAADAYQHQVDDYNKKVKAFNECSKIVLAARRTEKEAHQSLLSGLPKLGGEKGIGEVAIGTETVAEAARKVREGVTKADELRESHIEAAKKITGDETIYEKFAAGRLDKVSPETQRLLDDSANHTTGRTAREHLEMAKEYNKMLAGIGDPAGTSAASYESAKDRVRAQLEAGPADAAKTAGSRVLKALPYAGAADLIYTEAKGAATGEQSWGEAVGRTVSVWGGAEVGGDAGAALGEAFGPVGGVVGGVVGGAAGAIGGDKVVDWIKGDGISEPEIKAPPAEFHRESMEELQMDTGFQYSRHWHDPVNTSDRINRMLHKKNPG